MRTEVFYYPYNSSRVTFNETPYVGGSAIWHSGNDGSGSGLDADTVDGIHESTFMRRTANSTLNMANFNISNVNHLTFNDAGANEGLQWLGGNDWRIFESPDSLTNAAGNLQFTTGGTRRMTIRTDGTLNALGAITATGNITAYSDERLKDNITPIAGAVAKVATLGGYTYTRNDLKGDRVYAGLIAQQVEQVLPEAVSESDDGTKMVDYNATIALLVEAMKELKSEVDDLKQQLEQN